MLIRTPKQVTVFLDKRQHTFDTPEAYLGDEPNTYRWTPEEWAASTFRTVLLAPFDYLQGMGNTTIPLMYQLLNQYNHTSHITERCYSPTSHRESKMLEQAGIPLFGLETRHTLPDYDLIAFTLSYPGYLFNIVRALKCAGIPVRWRDREAMTERYPLIITGGHMYANPWVTAPIVDIIFCGEAEDETAEAAGEAAAIRDPKTPLLALGSDLTRRFGQYSANPGFNALLDDLESYKRLGTYYTADGREKMLYELAKRYSFLFVPRFYEVVHAKKGDPALETMPEGVYDPNKTDAATRFKGINVPLKHVEILPDVVPTTVTIADADFSGQGWRIVGFRKRYADLPDRVRKRFVRNLDLAPALTRPVVPFNDPSWVGTVQIARGCSYRCGFCAASYREAPYRERSQASMVDNFREVIKNSGTADVSPLVLEFGTYSRKKALMREVMETVTDEFSMPSLRIDVFGRDPVFGQLAVHAQKKSVTIAVEGNSQKMREVISKGITAEDVLRSIANAIAAGYESAKLYMISNLPGETQDQTDEILDLCRQIDTMKRSVGSNMKVRLSWKPLTVQAWTPMQWFQARNWLAHVGDVMKQLQAMGFGTQLGEETRSALGNFLQVAELADDVAGEALCDTMIEADTTTFGSLPRRVYDIMTAHLTRYGRSIDDYYRQKDEDEIFAWDLIDTRISKQYLLRHYQAQVRRVNEDPDQPIYGAGFLERFGGCQIGCTQCGACQDAPGEDNHMFAQMEEFAGRTDEPVRLADIRKIDKKSQRQRLLLTVRLDPSRRYPTRKYWTYVIRRACYQIGANVATDSLLFATDRVKAIKRHFAGKEFVEIGFVDPVTVADADWPAVPSLKERLNEHLVPFGLTIEEVLQLTLDQPPGRVRRLPEAYLWQLEVDQPLVALREAIRLASEREYTKFTFKVDNYRMGEQTQVLNLRDVLRDAWAVTKGTAVQLHMLTEPQFSPYDVANALIGSRTDVYRYPALLLYGLTHLDAEGAGVFHCQGCGRPIPEEFYKVIDTEWCHRCQYDGTARRQLVKA